MIYFLKRKRMARLSKEIWVCRRKLEFWSSDLSEHMRCASLQFALDEHSKMARLEAELERLKGSFK